MRMDCSAESWVSLTNKKKKNNKIKPKNPSPTRAFVSHRRETIVIIA